MKKLLITTAIITAFSITNAKADDIFASPDGSYQILEDDGTLIDGSRNEATIYDHGETISSTRNSATIHDYGNQQGSISVREVGSSYIVDLGSDILFSFDSYDLTPIAAAKLDQVAELIKNDRKGYVVFRGHTDSLGADSYNVSLSENRANAVAGWLLSNHNLDADYMRVQGYGESYPKASNATIEGQAENRRVEIIIQREANAPIPEVSDYVTIVSGANGSVVTNGDGTITAKGNNNNHVKMDGSGLSGTSRRGNTIDMDNGKINIKSKNGNSVNILKNMGF